MEAIPRARSADRMDDILERAGKPFPREPVRSLDAIHLASALELLQAFPELKVLSHDAGILANLPELGLPSAV